jgi:thioredoxin
MLLKVIFGLILGASIGGLIGMKRSCETGACPLTANPSRGAFFGGILGCLFTLSLAGNYAGETDTATGGSGNSATLTKNVTTVTKLSELKKLMKESKNKTALVVFSAPWCPSCKKYEPVFETFAEENASKVSSYKVNTDNASKLSQHFDIKYLPTTVIFKDNEEVDRFVGFKDAKGLKKISGA